MAKARREAPSRCHASRRRRDDLADLSALPLMSPRGPWLGTSSDHAMSSPHEHAHQHDLVSSQRFPNLTQAVAGFSYEGQP